MRIGQKIKLPGLKQKVAIIETMKSGFYAQGRNGKKHLIIKNKSSGNYYDERGRKL